MLRRLTQVSVFRLAYTHSFYAPHTLEYPINQSEEGYQKNRKMMDEVNSQFKNILKQVTPYVIS